MFTSDKNQRFLSSGDNEDRTRDLLLARQALSQLSYTPIGSGTHLLSHAVPSVVSSAVRGLTIVFGMGTGVSPGRIGTRNLYLDVHQFAALRFGNPVPSSCHSPNGLPHLSESLRTPVFFFPQPSVAALLIGCMDIHN